MDEENKQEQQKDGSYPHVQVFGMDVNTSSESKEDWRARKEEWKAQHHEQRDQNREQRKAQHEQWRHDHPHEGGLFFGMIVLFAGVVALLYTMGLVSHAFWHVILPFWPILLILWGASIILGRHWFARFIIFLLALAFLVAVIFYGLVKTDSPVVSFLSPTVVSAIQKTHTQY
jgi:cation transport ATPase